MSSKLLTKEELPHGFEYPSDFIRFVEMEIFIWSRGFYYGKTGSERDIKG